LTAKKLIPSPLNPHWLIPRGWENILGVNIDYRLGDSVLHLWRVQFNQHAQLADRAQEHTHRHHQLLYYQRGHGKLEANAHIYTVMKGSIFFVPAGCGHRFKPTKGEAPICLALDFSIAKARSINLGGLPMKSEVAILLSLLHAESARPYQLRQMDQQLVDQCIDEIIVENQKRQIGYASLIQAHLLRLIALCLRATQRASGFGEHFRHTSWRYHLLTERVIELIRANATRMPELTLCEAARTCGASANHLNRILKNQTGLTFQQLVLRRRLDLARELLQDGKLNCTEAAHEAGFNDSNYFSRAFRKIFGYSPSQLGKP